jgi:protein-tyrosine phosphatase
MGHDPFVTLEGVSNFRDAGGMATAQGGHIRRGLLYRSSRLSRLTDADRALLGTLGIRHLYDLREPNERERSPTRWPGPAIRTWGDRDHLTPWSVTIQSYPQDPEGMRRFLIDLYAELPHAFAPRIADIVRDLGAGKGPCVVHCSAGKDRTGVVIGVLLALAGVDRAAIVAEYILTAGRLGIAADQQKAFGDRIESAVRSPEAQQALWAADAAFLDAAFASVEARHETLTGYAKKALGLTEADIAVFREALVED